MRDSSGGWIIYGNSDKLWVDEESLNPFLAVHLKQDNPQALGVRVGRLKPGSGEEEIYDPDASWCILVVLGWISELNIIIIVFLIYFIRVLTS